jgi:anhydro-N-acetylmuramic acid kinase
LETPEHYIGLMSGTSLDGIDAVLIESSSTGHVLRASRYQPYSTELRARLLALHEPANNELQDAAIIGNELARCYATAVNSLLQQNDSDTGQIRAIGCHGQTVRHRPDLGFTLQLGNPALLAELTSIAVVADFRSRDIAAGGQGAPLVPAFHQALFAHRKRHRAIINIGGIANITNLPPNGKVTGFDCGPGNLLMDSWAQRHLGKPYDAEGRWAASGQPISSLLQSCLDHPFFQQAPPKSTGRDTFNMAWLEQYLQPGDTPADVQATLLELTARSIGTAIQQYCGSGEEIFLCGGGAHNKALFHRLQNLFDDCKVDLTDSLGIGVDWVEAAAFAWLAKQAIDRRPGNLPAVTGAAGPRILGAIYPA